MQTLEVGRATPLHTASAFVSSCSDSIKVNFQDSGLVTGRRTHFVLELVVNIVASRSSLFLKDMLFIMHL